jgi:hypothetical protein
MKEKKPGRPKLGSLKKIAYNGKLEPIKIEVIGGTKECNRLAYEYLTKRYNLIINGK